MNSDAEGLRERALALVIAAVAVLCFKFTFIGAFAGPVPFWDEWDAQGLNLFLPYLDGRLGFLDWFAAHNEHRATSARIVWLLTFIFTDRWDTIAIMMVNAVIHTAVVIFLARMLSESTSRKAFLALVACTAVLLAVPFGWENSIWSLQTMWYFLLLFSFMALTLIVSSVPFSYRWWMGGAFSICAYFSMSSAVATLMAAAMISCLQMCIGRRSGMREHLAVLCYVAIGGMMIFYVPQLNPSESVSLWTKAFAIFGAIVRYASWPLPSSIASAVVLNAPALILAVRMVAQRSPIEDFRWKLLALIFWSWVAIAMIAFGRPTGDGGSSRYQDILLVGLTINFSLVLRAILDAPSFGRFSLIAVIWVAVVSGVLLQYFCKVTSRDIVSRYNSALEHVHIVGGYLGGRDDAILASAAGKLPYPFADRLVSLLSRYDVAGSLPKQIQKDTPGRGWLFWEAVVQAGPFRHFLFIVSPLLLVYSVLLYGVVVFRRVAPQKLKCELEVPKLTRPGKDL